MWEGRVRMFEAKAKAGMASPGSKSTACRYSKRRNLGDPRGDDRDDQMRTQERTLQDQNDLVQEGLRQDKHWAPLGSQMALSSEEAG